MNKPRVKPPPQRVNWTKFCAKHAAEMREPSKMPLEIRLQLQLAKEMNMFLDDYETRREVIAGEVWLIQEGST